MKFKDTNKIVQNKVWTKSIKQWLKAKNGYPTITKFFIKFDNDHLIGFK